MIPEMKIYLIVGMIWATFILTIHRGPAPNNNWFAALVAMVLAVIFWPFFLLATFVGVYRGLKKP